MARSILCYDSVLKFGPLTDIQIT